MVFSQSYSSKVDALLAEKQIKKWSQKKKEALIRGDYDLLKKLAVCAMKAVARIINPEVSTSHNLNSSQPRSAQNLYSTISSGVER